MNESIQKLTEIIEKDLIENIYSTEEKLKIAKEYKSVISNNALVIAQCNPLSGDIKYNATKAKKWITWANLLGVNAIIFPEAFLIGIPFGDYLLRFPLIIEECKEWLDVLAEQTTETKVIIGFIEKGTSDKYYNSIAVLCNGKIETIIRKSQLTSHAESNENRYFASAQLNSRQNITIGENNVNIFIGNDININNEKSIPAEYLVNCSSSISRTNTEALRHNKLSNLAKKYNTPIIYINQVGSSDCLSFDGSSRVYDKNGKLIYRAKSFEEQFFIVNQLTQEGIIYPMPNGSEKNPITQIFSLDYESDLERTYKTIIQSIKDYFKKTGFKHACLGLSGGLDSTVCAVLLADAIGKENVFGISMPSKITSSASKNDAKDLANNLGINFLEAPIKDMFDTTRKTFDNLFDNMESKWAFRYKQSYTNDNIQARARATILWGIANEFEKCIPIATSDKSEAYMGYATINGDMSGGFAPIADVTKTKLFALAKWMNKNRKEKNAIPQSIIEKRPGAELAINPNTGKPLLAEEALMPYEFLDEVIWRVENLQQSINDMINTKFAYEEIQPVSNEQKKEWLEKFFRRMSTALYKWSIVPPAPIIDAHSINKAEYNHPIIASNINYQKTTFEEKSKFLNSTYVKNQF